MGGILLDFIDASVDIEIAAQPHWMLPVVLKYASAVVLLAVLGYALGTYGAILSAELMQLVAP